MYDDDKILFVLRKVVCLHNDQKTFSFSLFFKYGSLTITVHFVLVLIIAMLFQYAVSHIFILEF